MLCRRFQRVALEPRTSRFTFADAMVLFAKSLGTARSGDFVASKQSAKVLGDTVEALKTAKNTYWAINVSVQYQTASLRPLLQLAQTCL